MSPDKRPCKHPEHEGARWLSVTKFHKRGVNKSGPYKGYVRYDSHCKTCRNRDHRANYHKREKHDLHDKERRKAYLRARSRTFTRLSDMVPELYERLLIEECEKEGLTINRNAIKSKKVG